MSRSRVELGDVQGDTLCGYGFGHAHYAFFEVTDEAAARTTLASWLPQVTVAAPWGTATPPYTLNLAFRADGLRALGLGDGELATFDPAFVEGMEARAADLGDSGPSGPGEWEPDLRAGRLHVLATLTARDAGTLESQLQALRQQAAAPDSGLARAYDQPAVQEPGSREHFGFRDGYGQPGIDDPVAGPRPRPGQGTPLPDGGWADVAVGEFVLGYRNEDKVVAPVPAPPIGLHGSYMVWRKLRQDVAGFWGTLYGWAGGDAAEAERLAAKVVGRWPDGTAVADSPDRPDPELASDASRLNDHRYGDDPGGRRCPLGAHVRRANPRDDLGWHGKLTKRHRIIRRGMPYGSPPADRLADDGEDRGLVFVCYQANLGRQFELVQGAWLMDGNAFGLGGDTDLLTGNENARGKMTIPGDPPRFLAPQRSFVTTRGGAYLFKPGLRGLAALTAPR